MAVFGRHNNSDCRPAVGELVPKDPYSRLESPIWLINGPTTLPSLHCLLKSTLRCVKALRFRSHGRCLWSWMNSLMAEHQRDMTHSPSLLCRSQSKIIVLRAFVSLSYPSQPS